MTDVTALFDCLTTDLKRANLSEVLSWPKQPPPDAVLRQVRAHSLTQALFKKYEELDNVPALPFSRAVLTFLECQYAAKYFSLSLPNSKDEEIFGQLKSRLYNFFNPIEKIGDVFVRVPLLCLTDLGAGLKPGPGASIKANGMDFYTKVFNSPLTASSEELVRVYDLLSSEYIPWREAEKLRKFRWGTDDEVIRGSRLSVVPKNNETGRCVCTEPNINMMFQLSVKAILEKRLFEVYGIGLEDQPFKNQALARRGSILSDQVTIDLKSASDSMSLTLMKSVLPSDVFLLLSKMRSPEIHIPGLGWYSSDIFCSMGNGFCFPLQTILFTCVIQAVADWHNVSLSAHTEEYGVFGDDLVFPTRFDRDVKRMLGLLGFTVNEDKSFNEGLFRESCGADFWAGADVRGIYLKRLRSQQDFYVAINRLNFWSMKTGIQIPCLVQRLLKRVRWLPIPLWASDDSGVKVPFECVSATLPKDRFTQSPLYRYYSVIPKKLDIPVTIDQNPGGALIALLTGAIRNGAVTQRARNPSYKLRWNVAPAWDYPPTTHPRTGWIPWTRWENAATINLFG